jgi:hypothetical protein
MAERKMLRELMTVQDIYNYAEPITDMLREEYGSYDADSLDEVKVEERFAQRLLARGYDVRPWVPVTSAPTPVAPPAPTPVTPAPRPASDTPVPVTVVRRGRPPGTATRSTGTADQRTTRPAAASDATRRAPSRPAAASSDEPRRGPGRPRSTPSANTAPTGGDEAPARPRRGRPPRSSNGSES